MSSKWSYQAYNPPRCIFDYVKASLAIAIYSVCHHLHKPFLDFFKLMDWCTVAPQRARRHCRVNADYVRTNFPWGWIVICLIARGVAIQFTIALIRGRVCFENLAIARGTWATFVRAEWAKTKLKEPELVLTNFWHYCHQSGEQFMQLLSILVPNEWKRKPSLFLFFSFHSIHCAAKTW